MRNELENESLAVISAIDKVLQSISRIVSLTSSLSNSSNVIDILADVEKELRPLETGVSILPLKTNNLMSIYGMKLRMFSNERLQMLEKVSEQDAIECSVNNIPSNTTNIEENALTDIDIRIDEMDSGFIVTMDNVLDQKEYSYISIVNRLKDDQNVLFLINQYMGSVIQDFSALITEYKSTLLKVRMAITDSEKITTLYEETSSDEMLDLIVSGVNGYTYRIGEAKKGLYKLFQIFITLDQNYKIYHEITADCASKVVECYFNAYSTFEIH